MSPRTSSRETKDLIVFGNLVLDDVVHADGTTRMGVAGGAVLYMPLAAALWGLSVGIVSPVGTDYPAEALEELARRGIDLSGLVSMDGPGLHTWLLYEGDLRRVVHRLDSAGHEAASPTIADLPRTWHGRWYHLAPIPLPMQLALAAALARRGPGRVSLDPYELIRPQGLERWQALTRDLDLFLFSEDELDHAPARLEPETFVRRLAPPAARGGNGRCNLAYKQGARGGLFYRTDEDLIVRWPGRAPAVVDPTGAGDAFAAGLVAGLLRQESIERSLCMGMVSAAFAIEAEGPGGLLAASPEQAEARLDESWREWTRRPDRSSS